MWVKFNISIQALLFLLSVQTIAEVMKSVSDCDRFLLDQTPPHIPGILEAGRILDQNRYKLICQTYGNQRRFVTLYDVRNRIPVFSADPNGDKKMIPEDKNRTYNHQAGAVDYRSNRTFDRGHIFPSSYASTKADKLSTFTLTNVVPQAESFNKGSWNKMERCRKSSKKTHYCVNSSGGTGGFVVTGALPSSSSTLNNRVNVPTALWSAFCCYSAVAQAWIASGHWGRNVQDESKRQYLKTETLEDLQHRLRRSNSEFVIFPGSKCPLTTTVTEFYPEMKNCLCPPTIPDPSPSVSGPSHSHLLMLFFPFFLFSYHQF
uniref:Endonuclease domain-containing 1 protein-like n=1 Tax=Poecilia reticulata TaxID=8081 RepID=A0A3P9N2G1_POERE